MYSGKQAFKQVRLPSLPVVTLACLLILVACAPPQLDDEAVQPSPRSATAVPAEAVLVPTKPSGATDDSKADEPETNGLVAFVQELETAVSNQDYADMQALMSDPIGVGAWRSEWRMYDPAQAMEEFQNAALPAPLAVEFTGLSIDEMTDLIGQPPASMFGPGINVVAALHSTGWGQSTNDEAILFVVEEDGRYIWSAFLYTNGSFAESGNGAVSAPVGIIYRTPDDGYFQVQPDGEHRQLLDEQAARIPSLQISPNGRHAAYLDDQRHLWLINTVSGEQQQLASDVDLSNFLAWGDAKTLLTGVWLDPSEGEGPNNGHIALLDIHSDELQILDEANLSGNRPAYLSDYTMVAFDVFAAATTGRLYHPDSGVRVFDPSTFEAGNEMIRGPLFNPAWTANGEKIAWLTSRGERFAVQAFEFEENTAVQLHDWDPARFGGLVPAPAWSPDGQRLVLEVWGNGPEGSGVWVLAADGSSQTLVDAAATQPYWVNDFQLVFNVGGEPRLHDVGSGEQFRLDLPDNSSVVGFAEPEDLLASSGSIPVADTPVNYLLALQNVTMHSGPGEEYAVIGDVFDGQAALVTGQSLGGHWWRVICPDDSVGDCWVTADPAYTIPSDVSGRQSTMPDPASLKVASETTVESPDGRWKATAWHTEPVLVDTAERFFASLTVTDGETSWTPIAEWRGYGLGFTWPAIYRWSPDSSLLTYTNMLSPDGCSIYSNGTDLYQLDVADGSIFEILPEGKTRNFSLSPDESTLAYTTNNGQQEVFVLRATANGAERSVIPIERGEDVQSGEIFWSADGRTVVLTFASNACSPSRSSSIVRIDTETVAATTLIEKDDAHFFFIYDWPEPNRPEIRLIDKDDNIWRLNVNSGALVQES